MPVRHRIHWVVLPCLLALLGQSCGSKKVSETTQTTPKVPELQQVHVFLETSASMGGYLQGGTTFKNVVADLMTKANQIKPVTAYTVDATVHPAGGDVQTFVQTLATTKLATARGSELHKIFAQVGQKASPTSVAILISDCILSFPDAEIKKNPALNITDAESVLKSAVNAQFAALRQRGMGATVMAYKSAFNGTYYDCQNRKVKLPPGELRPFYIWIIGPQALLPAFRRDLMASMTRAPEKLVDFTSVKPTTQYDLFYSLNKTGTWEADNIRQGGLTRLRAKADRPAEFAIGLNLSGLPAYAQQPTYITPNLRVSSAGATVSVLSVRSVVSVTTKGRDQTEQKLLHDATHVLTLRVSSLFENQADVSIRMPVLFDTWYAADGWSTMDDRTPAGRNGRTFALEHLLNGVSEAYRAGTNEFVNTTVHLTK